MVITTAAIVAQISQIFDIRLPECQALFHGWKNCAMAFAIPTRVTNRHDPFSFNLGGRL
jgi:hypothetical protein